MSIPTAEELSVQTALPNDIYGSDHICIGAVLDLIS